MPREAKDWRNDHEAHREWERRYRQTVIVPAVPVTPELGRGGFEPALWDIDPTTIKPGKGRGSN